MNVNAWKLIEALLREDRRFRGDTFVSFGDLKKLGDAAGFRPDPRGGVAKVQYSFEPDILQLGDSKGNWFPEAGSAMAMATTQSSKEVGAGRGAGGTTVKTNWGGRVHTQHAPVQPSTNDRLGSSMDRYDVMMTAEFGQRINRKGTPVPDVVMTRVAWAPSIGTQEERTERLQALMSGQRAQPLKVRPQGERPVHREPDDDPKKRAVPDPKPLPRIGQNVRAPIVGDDDDDSPAPRPSSGGQASSDFKRRLAAISKKFYRDDED